MAIALKRTGSTNQYVNMLVYGQSGAGKTTLCSTIDNIIILSAEGGLLSLPEGIPYLEIKTVEDLYEAYEFITEGEGKEYTTVALDSITEIAEVVLANEKDKVADARQAYMKLGDIMSKLIRSFRDLEKHTIIIAKAEKDKDESGKMLWSPMMPGAKLAQSLPYHFDEVLALRVEHDEEGNNMHMIQTHNDGLWSAKDRSGKLGDWEDPNLSKIIGKILSKEDK
jgi:hypothetical protein